jgi:hypothetical protein
LKTANQPAGESAFVWAFYYSLEMITTLGLGDLQPNTMALRLVSVFHTLIGYSLIAVSITWTVLIFPALRRMRTLARRVSALDEAEGKTGVPVASPRMHNVLTALAQEVVQMRVDYVHFPILFYFYADDHRASLPHAIGPLMRFAAEGTEMGRDELVRLSATGLEVALTDLARAVAERLGLGEESMESVFRKFLEMHTS